MCIRDRPWNAQPRRRVRVSSPFGPRRAPPRVRLPLPAELYAEECTASSSNVSVSPVCRVQDSTAVLCISPDVPGQHLWSVSLGAAHELRLKATVLGRTQGTPVLRSNVCCVAAASDDETESEWAGFG
eukprot:TRINITY_DN22905_c0_g1_i1.p1 TRINITY_DN22905_c0_g1~~TRINITY_DN22905_c0_g1_i1.p1  ORF type:complete len:128 (+),score=27.70 TRINITY_DN22905_c0_g1_i1:189-572(+)